jgi:hypothetical protein
MRYLLAFLFILVILIHLYIGTNSKIIEGAANKNCEEQLSSLPLIFYNFVINGNIYIWTKMWPDILDILSLFKKKVLKDKNSKVEDLKGVNIFIHLFIINPLTLLVCLAFNFLVGVLLFALIILLIEVTFIFLTPFTGFFIMLINIFR